MIHTCYIVLASLLHRDDLRYPRHEYLSFICILTKLITVAFCLYLLFFHAVGFVLLMFSINEPSLVQRLGIPLLIINHIPSEYNKISLLLWCLLRDSLPPFAYLLMWTLYNFRLRIALLDQLAVLCYQGLGWVDNNTAVTTILRPLPYPQVMR